MPKQIKTETSNSSKMEANSQKISVILKKQTKISPTVPPDGITAEMLRIEMDSSDVREAPRTLEELWQAFYVNAYGSNPDQLSLEEMGFTESKFNPSDNIGSFQLSSEGQIPLVYDVPETSKSQKMPPSTRTKKRK
jgi:hypothetical protein